MVARAILGLLWLLSGWAAADDSTVTIAAGSFWRGSDDAARDEVPKRIVVSEAFEIDRDEVTAGAYLACVDAGSCTAARMGGLCTFLVPERQSHPINCVSWEQARAYCAFVKKRLPTESEWERAARGNEGQEFVWGSTWPPPTGAGNFADSTASHSFPGWVTIADYEDGYSATSPVGSAVGDRSPAGVRDMAGNVLEWVADGYRGRLFRVVRGASFGHHARQHLAASSRFGYRQDVTSAHIGFRCARSP